MAKHVQTLEKYTPRFGIDFDKWTIEQWRTVATDLAQRIDLLEVSKVSVRGRPKSAGSITSAHTNYQALAWQAKELVEASLTAGKKLEIKTAVENIMRESAGKNNYAGFRVDAKLETAYTEVRKILKAWQAVVKAEK